MSLHLRGCCRPELLRARRCVVVIRGKEGLPGLRSNLSVNSRGESLRPGLSPMMLLASLVCSMSWSGWEDAIGNGTEGAARDDALARTWSSSELSCKGTCTRLFPTQTLTCPPFFFVVGGGRVAAQVCFKGVVSPKDSAWPVALLVVSEPRSPGRTISLLQSPSSVLQPKGHNSLEAWNARATRTVEPKWLKISTTTHRRRQTER